MWNFLSNLVILLGTFVGLTHLSPPPVPQITTDAIPSVQIASSTAKNISNTPTQKNVQKLSPQVRSEQTHNPARTLQSVPQIQIEPITVPSTITTPTSTEPPRTYTNELGQIVTENGTVLWSPPKPVVAPTPTTTPVADEIACGYEVEAGLPLGSKCPSAFSSDGKPLFPCYPNQPWTCRNNPTPPPKCTITNREGFTYQRTCQ